MNTICEFFLGERNIFILCITFFKHLGLVFDNQIETFDRIFYRWIDFDFFYLNQSVYLEITWNSNDLATKI